MDGYSYDDRISRYSYILSITNDIFNQTTPEKWPLICAKHKIIYYYYYEYDYYLVFTL